MDGKTARKKLEQGEISPEEYEAWFYGLNPPNKRGRPRIHWSDKQKMRRFRRRQKAQGRKRLDVYISLEARLKLTKLCETWRCSKSEAVDRVLREQDAGT